MSTVVLVLLVALALGLLRSLVAERRHHHPLGWVRRLPSLGGVRDHAPPGAVERPVLALGLVFLGLAFLAPALWELVS